MIPEIYQSIAYGHWYQRELTGPPPVYNADYSRARYDRYATTRSMSQLRFELASKLFKFDSVLDVGYGNGDFLKYCLEKGKKCFAWDIADYPLPKEVIKTEHVGQHSVDLVTFFDSLEHHPSADLFLFLESIPAKNILVSLPWCHFPNPEWFLKWKHRRENEHLHHLTASGLLRTLELARFIPVYIGSPEDKIRGQLDGLPNILTAAATRMS